VPCAPGQRVLVSPRGRLLLAARDTAAPPRPRRHTATPSSATPHLCDAVPRVAPRSPPCGRSRAHAAGASADPASASTRRRTGRHSRRGTVEVRPLETSAGRGGARRCETARRCCSATSTRRPGRP
jgi:hypothetical protein